MVTIEAFALHTVLRSEATQLEREDVLSRDYFTERFSPSTLQDTIDLFATQTSGVEVTSSITDCRDRKDNKFIELALDGAADVIVSGDEDLLVLHPWRGIPILSPRDALAILEADDD